MERRKGMSISNGFYLAYSLPRNPGSRALADSFSIIEVKDSGDTLVVQSVTGSRTLTKVVSEWRDSATIPKLTVTARMESIRANSMIIGRAVYQPTQNETRTDVFVAIKMFTDSNPLLIDGATTSYGIYYENGDNESLSITKAVTGNLDFGFRLHGADKIAQAPAGQSPGRFNATKTTGDHDLYGFVLPHRIQENGNAYRVLVGFAAGPATKGGEEVDPWSTDDIDPYVAVSTSSGLSDDDFP
jgi:hypothetical protein